MKSAFDQIVAGLKDAIMFQKGDATRARVRAIKDARSGLAKTDKRD